MTDAGRAARLAALSACLFGGTLRSAGIARAETVVHDNTDATFLFTPHVYSLGYGYSIIHTDYLSLYRNANENAEPSWFGVGEPFLSQDWQFWVPPNHNVFQRFGGNVALALADEVGTYDDDDSDPIAYQRLRLFQPGDAIGADWFADGGPPGYDRGPVAVETYLATVPLLGDEAIVGWRYEEAGGTRYGFLCLAWVEQQRFAHVNGGSTVRLSLYLPSAWGYSDTLDEPVTVVLPCLADLDGNGMLNLDDAGAFAAIFLAGDPAADLDGSGVLNVDDFEAFVAVFVAGC